jgi:hypothetical protein
MSRKKNNHELKPAESKDQLIVDLIQQRKLQQDALQKIMTSMEKEKEAMNDSLNKELPRRKRVIEKIFNTDKKKQ